MDNKKIKVLFIAGSGRSGSTILHNILGQLYGFSAFGELRYIWERGLMKNLYCGCGPEFRQCEFWGEVFGRAYGGMDQVDANEMYRFTESFRIQNLPLTSIPGQKKKETERLQVYLGNLEKLYQAIQSTARANVIVDSSKNPSYGYLLQQIPSLELYVLHFVRDSRAVAHSWSKVKEFQPGVKMARKMPVKSALQWDARNLMTELFLNRNSGRHQVLRYEDFINRPRESIESVINLLGETTLDLPFVSTHTVDLQNANHSVFGNPVRFQTGLVELKLDNSWKKKMDQAHKLAVAGLTWPLQRRYGYF